MLSISIRTMPNLLTLDGSEWYITKIDLWKHVLNNFFMRKSSTSKRSCVVFMPPWGDFDFTTVNMICDGSGRIPFNPRVFCIELRISWIREFLASWFKCTRPSSSANSTFAWHLSTPSHSSCVFRFLLTIGKTISLLLNVFNFFKSSSTMRHRLTAPILIKLFIVWLRFSKRDPFKSLMSPTCTQFL